MYDPRLLEDMRWQEAAFLVCQRQLDGSFEPLEDESLSKEKDERVWYTVAYDPVARRVERIFSEQEAER